MNPALSDSNALDRRSALEGHSAIWWPVALFIAWIVAWVVDIALRDTFHWNVAADTAYWVAMKLALWVLPTVVILRKRAIPVAEYVGLRTPLRGLAIGVLAGLGLLAFSYAMDAILGGASFNIPVLDAALFNGVIVAPLVEEFTIRGFYLESLERSAFLQAKTRTERKFTDANMLQGIVFVAMHLPGWFWDACDRRSA